MTTRSIRVISKSPYPTGGGREWEKVMFYGGETVFDTYLVDLNPEEVLEE